MKSPGVLLGICLCYLASEALATNDARVHEAVDTPARAFFAANPTAVGASIGVWQHGSNYTFNFGSVLRGGRRAPTADTIYAIGSITKTFTGILLAQAQLAGKLRLDDDVRKYLNGSYPNLEFDGHPIRICDLVDHRSGLPFLMPERPELLPDFPGDEPMVSRVARILAHYSRADFFDDLHRVKIETVPGEGFKYSNTGAMLAGYILERVYGESYESLLRRKILRPLGMTNTTITLSTKQSALRTRGYHGAGVLMPDNPDAIQGAGAIKSTVNDLLRYAAWQIRERDPAVQLAHRPYATSGNYAAGLNWQMLHAPGKRVIWQSGNLDGFHAYCIVEPELELALIVLFNQEDQTTNIAHAVLVNEILKNLEPAALLLP